MSLLQKAKQYLLAHEYVFHNKNATFTRNNPYVKRLRRLSKNLGAMSYNHAKRIALSILTQNRPFRRKLNNEYLALYNKVHNPNLNENSKKFLTSRLQQKAEGNFPRPPFLKNVHEHRRRIIERRKKFGTTFCTPS